MVMILLRRTTTGENLGKSHMSSRVSITQFAMSVVFQFFVLDILFATVLIYSFFIFVYLSHIWKKELLGV